MMRGQWQAIDLWTALPADVHNIGGPPARGGGRPLPGVCQIGTGVFTEA